MRKLLIIFAFAISAFVACQPEVYTGPLDSPIGNWDGVRSEYFFNGEKVADLDSCETSAIAFYRQGQCCIENVKGAFPFTYDNDTRYLQIDSTLWEVSVLTGAELVMTYLYTLYPADPVETSDSETPETPETPEEPTDPENPEDTTDPEEPGDPETPETPEEPTEPEVPEVKPDENGVILPAEFKGFEINANKNGYFYTNDSGETVYCNFKGWLDQDKNLIIDFWFDRHTDYFIPLVVDTKK